MWKNKTKQKLLGWNSHNEYDKQKFTIPWEYYGYLKKSDIVLEEYNQAENSVERE